MNRLLIVICVLVAGAAIAAPMDGIVRGTGTPGKDYAAPLLSNGELSLSVDWACRTRHAGGASGIFWQARRSGERTYPLLPQGGFMTQVFVDGEKFSEPEKWEQELDIRNALVHCRNRYAKGIEVDSTVFVPFAFNAVLVRQTIRNTAAETRRAGIGFEFMRSLMRQTPGVWVKTVPGDTLQYSWSSYGMYSWSSCATLMSGGEGEAKEYAVSILVHGLKKEFELKPSESRTVEWMLYFTDTLENEMCKQKVFTAFDHNEKRVPTKLAEETAAAQVAFKKSGFEGLLKSHQTAWADYYAQSFVRFPESELQRLSDMADYHLRCNATKWSFPVGISARLWNGRYFGFDEMNCYLGLVSANHLEIAKRCPLYRKATLKTAVYRQAHYGAPGVYGARWVWEAEESGMVEAAPTGFWLDHIFHMSNIAKSSYLQYLYSGDKEYLKEAGYPVILECARFFQNCATYRDSNGDTYIGKYTDLERLGTARNHPFMTTCGAIYTLRIAAKMANLLGKNLEEAKGFEETADALMKYLPTKNGRYVAYTDCKDESVATLSGFFPYPVIPSTDETQRKAVKHFFENGRKSGNMYPLGKKICPWYAGWMSITASYMEDTEEALRWLRESFSVAGLFGEYWEINEPTFRQNPWFTTAAGTCRYALNQLYVCDADDETRVACLTPDAWKDYAFRLPCQRGVMIDCEVKGGKFTKLKLTLQPKAEACDMVVALKPSLAKTINLKHPAIQKIEETAEKIRLFLRVEKEIQL